MLEKEWEKACLHFLTCINGVGAVTIGKLIEYYGNASDVFGLKEEALFRDPVMSEKQKVEFKRLKRSWIPEREWVKLKEKGIRIVDCMDQEYPENLKNIPDRPYLLYYKGKLPSEMMPSVAIIGARMCSEYGKEVAWEYSAELARQGIQIISGMASGIDGIAQRSALEHGGKSFGILGCGVDVCYPASNRPLYERLQKNGGILSEFIPGEQPEAGHFPMRNRIISGLADVLLVIEAKEKSGTRITVNMALEQGREIFAVPGRITDKLSRGCHLMIRDGAGMALSVEEVAEAAWQAWERSHAAECERSTKNKKRLEAEIEEKTEEKTENQKDRRKEAGIPISEEQRDKQKLLRWMAEKSMTVDEILDCFHESESVNQAEPMDIATLQSILTELVMEGRIGCQGGCYSKKMERKLDNKEMNN
ncbi:MAG: DNA-processing protein DprA [Lachnospiraceae bacterium]